MEDFAATDCFATEIAIAGARDGQRGGNDADVTYVFAELDSKG